MPTRSYQVINPVIEGTFKDVYDAKKPIDAANDMWKNLSQHIVSHVPKFMFTMREISGGGLHHFEVSEDKQKNSYRINKFDLEIGENQFNDFLNKVDQYGKTREQKGGHRRRKRYEDDDDSSSSSSTDIYPVIRRTSPIAMFHYNTRLYYTNDNLTVSTMNPQLVQITTPVFTPIFTPIFQPVCATFTCIWP